jgi:hypothetical protein
MAFIIPAAVAAISAIGSTVSAAGAAATIGTVASIGSGILGAVGAVQQGKAASQASKYNAAVQEQQANAEQNQAVTRATEVATRTRQRVAATRAGAIQNGFETDGSVADILSTVETQGTLEGLTALYDGSVRAQGLRSSAELNRASASSSLTAGYINAGTSVLSGFSKSYGKTT